MVGWGGMGVVVGHQMVGGVRTEVGTIGDCGGVNRWFTFGVGGGKDRGVGVV